MPALWADIACVHVGKGCSPRLSRGTQCSLSSSQAAYRVRTRRLGKHFVLLLSLPSSPAILNKESPTLKRLRLLKEGLLPLVKQRGMKIVPIAWIRNREAIHEVFGQDGGFLLRGNLSVGLLDSASF